MGALMTLSQTLPIHIQRLCKLLNRSQRPALALGLNGSDEHSGHAGLLRKLLLGEPAVFPPYFERVFADKPEIGNFQRHKLVLSALKTCLGRIISLHVRSEEHTSELQSLRHLVCR